MVLRGIRNQCQIIYITTDSSEQEMADFEFQAQIDGKNSV